MSEEVISTEGIVKDIEGDWKKVEEEFEDDATIYEFKEEGDSVEGTLEQVESDVGTNKSKMYTIKLEDESLAKIWGSSVLDTRMQKIETGSQVKIEYTGLKNSKKSGRDYKTFEVYHK